MKIKYGLTKKNISDAMDKMERQKDFLYSHYIEGENGKQIPLHLFARNTYVNSDRYIAELQNRVWSLVRFAEDRDLVNVFITLTLPSQYHRKKTLRNGKQIRNPKFAYQDVKIFDIVTKKSSKSMFLHEIKVHNSPRLNYWTGKTTIQSLWSRKSMKQNKDLRKIRTYSQLRAYLDFSDDIDLFISKYVRRNIELYDIETRERVFVYQSLVLQQKPIAKIPRWTGELTEVSLDPMDYMPLPATKKLTEMWTTIRKDRSWKDLDKDDRVYFRVTEPHKDGTPHLHISAWVPKGSVARLAQAIHRLFPAPLADISSTYIPDEYRYVDKAYKRNGKWHDGYKVDPNSNSSHYIKIHIADAVGYLMKYIYKTLDDLRGDKGISEITIWYLYHGICRFYTSRTLVSLDVYRPLSGSLGTLDQLTYMYRENTVMAWVDPDDGSKKPILIEYINEHGEEFIMWRKRDYELKLYGKDDQKTTGQRTMIRTVDVEIDGEEYYMYRSDDACRLYSKNTVISGIDEKEAMVPVTAMSMYELWNYYHSLNPDDFSLNMHHYGHVHNTMIERGLVEGEMVPIDHYNTDFPYYEKPFYKE